MKSAGYRRIGRYLDGVTMCYFLRGDFSGVSGVRYGSGTPKYYEPTSVLFGEVNWAFDE